MNSRCKPLSRNGSETQWSSSALPVVQKPSGLDLGSGGKILGGAPVVDTTSINPNILSVTALNQVAKASAMTAPTSTS